MARPWRLCFLHVVFFWVLLRATLSSPRPHTQEEPPYLTFVLNATDFPMEDYYDYIIVGGGTAGCPLAATLSQSYRVLVLERGGIGYGNPNLMSQEGFIRTLMEVDTFRSPAQAFTSEEGVPNARGRVLGGSSAINAGFYSRADSYFFHHSGVDWDLGAVNGSYAWVEKAVVFRPKLRSWQSAIRDGLLEAGVNPSNGFTFNHVVGTKIGGSTFDKFGRRHTSADLLSYAKPSHIRVGVHASVERVLLASTSANSGPKLSATGVVYRDQVGRYHHAMVHNHGEVILSAGAIGSPQLLLLSGVGPRPYLSYWGIPVAHHLPFVGQFLYDNPRNGISIVPPMPLEHSLIQVVGITKSGAYIEAASNVIPFASPARAIFLHTPSSMLNVTVATLMGKIAGPLSSGSLRLASTDVRINPIVRFNYFSKLVDLERCISSTRKIGEVLQSHSLDYFKFRDWYGNREFMYVGSPLPADLSNSTEMAEHCRRTVTTIWHYHGGCVVGKVVDKEFRVLGVNALRIVDGSTLNVSPGTNPQATLMMLGRYVGLKMRKERSRPK
ncbi:(R)-mandelonitrile lyase-like [Rhodamnia argentea]|uniref:(R)-mandelonitrile lyase-like n=1 Tax=Rhodamnia argentea TaxID=178133 RepID=A0A8B8QVQ8_9MYRT|nr:(R)-mandelonitrile lyase-like [Rhodamnia argentea]XP_048140641.1 (R)-mandelonitrile lyase-like [Rhodamnia argentea]